MSKVELKNIGRTFSGDVHTVSNVDIEVEDKELFVLLGPPGSGKTVILKMIAGLENVSEGEIHINGSPVNKIPPADRDIAMVFQNCALYPHMSVYSNMTFGNKIRKLPKEEIRKRVDEANSILGIEDLLNRKPAELSEMQKRLTAIGRAFVRKAGVLLIDGFMNGLDEDLKIKIRAKISKLHLRTQSTIIYATHDPMEAMTTGSRIAVIHDGLIQQTAGPLTLYEKPANKFTAGFIGSPAMNFIEGRLAEKDGSIYFLGSNTEVRAAEEMKPALSDYTGQEIIFGIRPEDIYDRLLVGQDSADNTIKASAETIEPAGSEVFLYLNSGGNKITARVDAHTQASAGQELELVFDMDKVHFFDKDSEETIV